MKDDNLEEKAKYYKVSYNYHKLVSHIQNIVTGYINTVQPLIYRTDMFTTYLVTLTPTNNINIEELKRIRPLFLKLLDKYGIKYFLATEIGKNGLFHYHLDIVVPKRFKLKQIIDKYFSNNMIKKHYSNIKYDITKINNPEKGGYDYPIKYFNFKRKQAFEISDFQNQEFFEYIRKINKYIKNSAIYNLFDTNIFEIVSYEKSKTLRYKMSLLRMNKSISIKNFNEDIEEVFQGFNWTTIKSKS